MKYGLKEYGIKVAFCNWLLLTTMQIIGAKSWKVTYKKTKRSK